MSPEIELLEPTRAGEDDDWARLGDPELRNTIRRICLGAGWTRPQQGVNRSMGVAGVMDGEGGSLVAQAIAIATALDVGSHTLLVDCNTLQPSLGDDFGIPDSPGLLDVLSSAGELSRSVVATIQPSGLRHLSLLPVGESVSNPSRLLWSPRMSDLLRHLSGEYPFVILDMPSVLDHPDAAVLARQVDGMVLVVRAGHTQQRALQQAVGVLSGATLHGVVLNRQRSRVPRLIRWLLAL